MTGRPDAGAAAPAPFDWEGEGLRVGESLDRFHCIVVLGEDVEATALVALGLARAQSGERRVAVGDLLGEAPPLQGLVRTDDPHGLVDSFLYGVSLNRIARPVADAGELFILPSGSQPLEYEEMLANARWRRLASGFREVGALLILAAPASAPGIEQLVDATDGAVLVGEAVPPQLPVAQVIASVRAHPAAPEPTAAVEPETEATPRARRWTRPSWPVLTAGLAAAVLFIVAGVWLARRQQAIARPPVAAAPPNTTSAAAAGAIPDSAAADSLDAPDASTIVPPVTNPGDSATAAAFAVSWLKLNTEAGALQHLQGDGKGLPAATFAPVLVNSAPWYELRVGAYANAADAESLLVTLRGNELLPPDAGTVVRAPFAFVIDSASSAGDEQRLLGEYAARQLPVYALRRPNGRGYRLYVGAFASPIESSLYAGMLRASGIEPVLAYRTGRVF